MPLTSNNSMPMQVPAVRSLATAVIQTVAYVDVFDYPLLPAEVHRYLIGMAAPLATVKELLSDGELVPQQLERREGYITLPGRQQIIAIRREREALAHQLWPNAVYYGGLIASVPFVRMVAVTGSLAVNNSEPGSDIDYLVVTANDRLWLSRAFIILIVRLAARRGIHLCPNYLLSERALVFPEQNLYTAHELAQMVPLSGERVYRRIRYLNQWADEWLPNATNAPDPVKHTATVEERSGSRLQGLMERGLKGGLGRRLEKWEMERKLAKFSRQAAESEGDATPLEVHFSADWCKGHFDGHAHQIMNAYDERVHTLGIER